MLNILLGQTIGICNCSNIEFTPFEYINSYLNISDKIGDSSLFESEINKINEYIQKTKDIGENKFALSIFDELFSSTNYFEGISTTYAYCTKFNKLISG